ncbi:MAG TPA: DNA polymerase Y family protein, partial [bacterium]|nr:DNA polymerase Y family protein [bacterium]
MGCVEVPALPLQILLKTHPEWSGKPVVVVAEEKPQGAVLFANPPASRAGVRPGMRYAVGLSLSGDLRAGVVSPTEIAAAVQALAGRLQEFTPYVEPFPADAGVFWLDLGGLDQHWPDWKRCASAVRSATADLGFASRVVVGFSRFGTWAVAKVTPAAQVFADPGQERAAALQVPIARLSLDASLRNMLRRLDIRTVADFVRLPADGVLQRFGADAHRLHGLAAGALVVPLQPRPADVPFREGIHLEDPIADAAAALFLIKGLLHRLLSTLAEKGQCLSAVSVGLTPEGLPAAWHKLRPAAPTLDQGLLL